MKKYVMEDRIIQKNCPDIGSIIYIKKKKIGKIINENERRKNKRN